MMDYRNTGDPALFGLAAESVTSDGPVSQPFSEGRPDRRASGRRARRDRRLTGMSRPTQGSDTPEGAPAPIAERGSESEDCCGGGFLTGYSLAMAYFPDQSWDGIYEDEEAALKQGTLFAALDFPFCPGCRR